MVSVRVYVCVSEWVYGSASFLFLSFFFFLFFILYDWFLNDFEAKETKKFPGKYIYFSVKHFEEKRYKKKLIITTKTIKKIYQNRVAIQKIDMRLVRFFVLFYCCYSFVLLFIYIKIQVKKKSSFILFEFSFFY